LAEAVSLEVLIRGLPAGAVQAEQREALSLADLEAYIAQRLVLAVALAQYFDVNCRGHRDISTRYMDLSPTAKVVLGMIASGARTGYDIKRTVERSTAFFWGASYGQIYPELERLERGGLVKGKVVAGGRARREYSVTAKGR